MESMVIQTHQLTKTFKEKKAIQSIDFQLKKGDICAFIGRNGAGKSTFFKLLSGQLNVTEGEINLFNQPLKNNEKIKKRFGFMIESPTFFPDFTAEQNLEYFRIQRGIVERNQIKEVLEIVELSDEKKTKFNNYSMGMKQRLGIALCLLGSPDCLVLDEPTNGLDAEGIKDIRALLLKLNEEKQMTILISSHILAELQLLAKRFVFIKNGAIVEDLTKTQIDAKGRHQIKLQVDQQAKAAQLLENNYPDMNYQVLPQQGIQIFSHINKSGEINRLLISNGVMVIESRVETLSLEEYFLDVVGGRANE